MSLNIPIDDIIGQERLRLKPLKNIADFQLDTTNLEVPELNKTLLSIFSKLNDQKFNLRIMSFGFKHGIPREADIVMDVRFLENPYYNKNLRIQNGKDNDVIKFVKSQSCFDKFHKNFLNTIKHLFKFYKIEGKKYLTIAFGCTGGVHRSVVVAETIFDSLASLKLGLYIDHRDIEMIGIVIVSHADLALQFIVAIEHVVGKQKKLECVCIHPKDDMEKKRKEIIKAIKLADSGNGVIVATDMFGGTPSNLAISI